MRQRANVATIHACVAVETRACQPGERSTKGLMWGTVHQNQGRASAAILTASCQLFPSHQNRRYQRTETLTGGEDGAN